MQFVLLVEGRATTKHLKFIEEYKNFFLYGIRKNKKGNKYTKDNISEEDYKKFILKYENLRKKIDSLK